MVPAELPDRGRLPALPPHSGDVITVCLEEHVGETQGPVVGWEMADVRGMDQYLWQPE